MLVVTIGGEVSADPTVIKWNGVTMTKATSIIAGSGATAGYSAIYYLPSPAAGTGPLNVSYSGNRACVYAVYATNVANTIPEASATGGSTSSSTPLDTTTPASITPSVGALVVTAFGGGPSLATGDIVSSKIVKFSDNSEPSQTTPPRPANASSIAASGHMIAGEASALKGRTTVTPAKSGSLVITIASFGPAGAAVFDHLAVTASSPQTAGAAFDVTITGQDSGNGTVNDSTTTVAASSPSTFMEFDWNRDGIYGDSSGKLAGGSTNILARNKKAETTTIAASGGGGSTTSPPSITINPDAFSQLQILVPGESAAPGTGSGKTGAATGQLQGLPFNVTVRAVDAYWNLVSTNDTVAITSTDTIATLPTDAPLVAGTKAFAVTLNTAGSFTVTATDTSVGGITAGLSASITVGAVYIWLGDGSANWWDTSTTNWSTASSVPPVAFVNGAMAVFDDIGSTTPAVDIVGTVTPSAIRVNSANNYTFGSAAAGGIGGSATLTKSGTGTLTLSSSANSYSGATAVNDGTVRLGDNEVIPNASSVTVAKGVLDINGRTETIGTSGTVLTLGASSTTVAGNTANVSDIATGGSLILGGNVAYNAGSATFNNGTASIAANLNLNNATRTFNIGDSDQTLTETVVYGQISGGGSGGALTKSGAGTLILSGANTYSGTSEISGGGIGIGIDSALPTYGPVGTGTLRFNNNTPTVFAHGAGRTIGNYILFDGPTIVGGANALEFTGTVDLGGNSGRVITVNNTANTTFSGTITSIIGGTGGGLRKAGPGVLIVSGNNDYNGQTTVDASGGTLRLGSGTAIPHGSGKGTVTVNTGGTLDVAGQSETINGLSGSGTVNNSTGSGTLIAGDNNAGGTFSGAIQNSSGTLALTKIGTGTLTLSGANTYSGATTISTGTLALSGSGTIASTQMGVAPGAKFDVSAITPAGYTLSGALSLSLNKAGPTLTQGQVALGAKTLAYGGTLTVVSNASSEAFASGNSFAIFTTTGTRSGWFSSVTLPSLSSGLSWDTNNLATSGVLDIYNFTTTALEMSTPVNSNAVVSAAKLDNHASSTRAASPYPTGWTAAATTPANGGSVVVNGNGSLTYTPGGAANVNGGTDSFTVTFQDGHGIQTMAVSVTVGTSSTGGQSPNVVASGTDGSGNFYALFAGMTNTTYTVETNSVVSGPTWVKYANYTTGNDGLINVTNVIESGPLFFRTVWPSY